MKTSEYSPEFSKFVDAPVVRLATCICAGLLLITNLPAPAIAQVDVTSCQQTIPILFPIIGDNSATWSANIELLYRNSLVLGDIDGDGNDELVTMAPAPGNQPGPQSPIQAYHWIQTGWSPMAPITPDVLAMNTPVQNPAPGTVYPIKIALADIDGDGRKEVVVTVLYGLKTLDQIYKYDPSTAAWNLLTLFDTTNKEVAWVRAQSNSSQAARVMFDLAANTMAIGSYVNGNFVQKSSQNFNLATGVDIGCTSRSNSANVYCLAFGDMTGDGLFDMVYLDTKGVTHALLSKPGQPFSIPTPITSARIAQVDPASTNVRRTWQLGDMAGDEKSDLIFLDDSGSLQAYYWDAAVNDFAPFVNGVKVNYQTINAVPESFTIVSQPIGNNYGVAAVGNNGVYFTSAALVNGTPNIVNFQNVDPTITKAAGFAPPQYSGYLSFAKENPTQAMIVRSANGIVNRVQSDTVFVEPNSLTDRGYPAYTKSQQAAYKYISFTAAHNQDIRSLYTDPAVPWASIQYKVETMPAPPASAGTTLADFQFVQKQTADELTSLQAVNLMYAATGQMLTNTYLVKDATLSEVTNALGLPADPDVAAQVINDVTAALNGLGAVAESAGSFMQLADAAVALAKIINTLNAAGAFAEFLGTVTYDTSTYTAPAAPDIATGQFNLKNTLDNSALGALTANACNQFASLSAWNTSKPIADGIFSGALPLDLATQQDILQANQSGFQLTVWQQLAPTVWEYDAVLDAHDIGCQNCLFRGATNYPIGYSSEARGICNVFGDSFNVSLLLENKSTNNYPNLTALNALFAPPPQGIGVNPADVFFGKHGWNMPYNSTDTFTANFQLNTGYRILSCSGLTPLVPALTPNVRGPSPESTASRIDSLIAMVQTGLTDVDLRKRLVPILQSAAYHVRQPKGRPQPGSERTIQLLNQFIIQSQWHALHSVLDSESSQAQAAEAVAIRDSLFNSTEVAGAR